MDWGNLDAGSKWNDNQNDVPFVGAVHVLVRYLLEQFRVRNNMTITLSTYIECPCGGPSSVPYTYDRTLGHNLGG